MEPRFYISDEYIIFEGEPVAKIWDGACEIAVKKFEYLKKKFVGKVGLIHVNMKKEEKDAVLKEFLNKTISILVSTLSLIHI